MDLTKYKNKSRILLIESPNYKLKDYLNNISVYRNDLKKLISDGLKVL